VTSAAVDLDLRVERRQAVLGQLVHALSSACPESEVLVRGSLCHGGGDVYSDIDLAWIVPDERFREALCALPRVLAEVGPVLLQRSDPDVQRSAKRRLLYVNFEHLPLFWRVDVDLRARSVAGDDRFDESNPDARGDDWSVPASALANAVAAVKAVKRRRLYEARGLLERAYTRLELGSPPVEWEAAVTLLARLAAAREPTLRVVAARVEGLARAPLATPTAGPVA
jgi:predicted nucleotidyltransferase